MALFDTVQVRNKAAIFQFMQSIFLERLVCRSIGGNTSKESNGEPLRQFSQLEPDRACNASIPMNVKGLFFYICF